MSRNMAAVASSALFVLLAAGLIPIPIPFVTQRLGQTVNVMGSTDKGPFIKTSDIPTGNSGDKLLMTMVSTVRVDSGISLPEVLLTRIAADSDAPPREVVYPIDKSDAEVQNEAVVMVDSSHVNVIVATLRAAGQTVTGMLMVPPVSLPGPTNGQLWPSDLTKVVGGSEVTTNEEVKAVIQTRAVGDPIALKVIHGGSSENVTVTTATECDDASYLGISLSIGYHYTSSISYRIDSSIVGPSAGLALILAIYDRITDGVLCEGRVMVGTGQVDAAGKVCGIGGIREKIKGAEAARAELFLMPANNYADLGDLYTDLKLVPVGTPKGAIAVLQLVDEG